jgi:hypothetical protein
MNIINNQSHLCGPASAQNQREELELGRRILSQLTAMGAIGSTGTLKARLEFAYSDVHERQIYPAQANELLTRVVLIITESFDDIDARVSVGDAADNQRLLPETGNDLSLTCAFETHPNVSYSSATSILLALHPGSSTSGRGIVLLYAD